MKRMLQIWSLAIILLWLLTESGWAIPQGVVIQGVLSNAAGQPLTGTRAWRIRFYDAQTSGNLLGLALSGTVNVAPSGRWTISLIPPAAVLNTPGEIWYELGIDSAPVPDGSVDPGDIFSGRTQVQSVLFSQRAADARTLEGYSAASFVTTSTLATALAAKFWGDGSDGDLTIDNGTTVTMTRDMFYNNLTVNGTLNTSGFVVFVAGTINGGGRVQYPDPNTGKSGSDGGAGGAAYSAARFVNIPGASGGIGTGTIGVSGNGGGNADSPGVNGAGGGNGGAGHTGPGNGGGGGTASYTFKPGVVAFLTLFGLDMPLSGTPISFKGSAGAGGGGSGGPSSNAYIGGPFAGGTGGGGGASGGIVMLIAKTWAGSFTIRAIGGDGGNGGNGVTGGGYICGGGGGGAGGSGGIAITIYGTKTWTGSYNLAGGAGGQPGEGTGTATAGSAGLTGVSYEIDAQTLTR